MYTTNVAIKAWAEDDRPREKMILKGKSILSDAELIAIILGSGTRTKSAVDLAQELLMSYGNSLAKLAKASVSELKKFNGVGDAKAVALVATLEIARRRKEEHEVEVERFKCSQDVYSYLKPFYQDLGHEEFRVIGLTRSNKIIRSELISIGGVSSTVVDGKIVFKRLIDMKAAACILSHNHPSGSLSPSEHDIKLTKNLVEFGKMIDLNVLDHVICTDNGYYSFADQGMMP